MTNNEHLVNEIADACMLVILNNTETPYDKMADLVIHENCGEVLETAVNALITPPKESS